MVDATGVEPVISSMSRKHSNQLSYASVKLKCSPSPLESNYIGSGQLCQSQAKAKLEARSGIEPLYKSFADSCLTAWLPRPLPLPTLRNR